MDLVVDRSPYQVTQVRGIRWVYKYAYSLSRHAWQVIGWISV